MLPELKAKVKYVEVDSDTDISETGEVIIVIKMDELDKDAPIIELLRKEFKKHFDAAFTYNSPTVQRFIYKTEYIRE